jgi:hypothetical protein
MMKVQKIFDISGMPPWVRANGIRGDEISAGS